MDAVALALAAGARPALSAAALKARLPSWPVLPLPESLEVLGMQGPGAVAHWRAEAGRVLDRAAPHGYDVRWPAHPAYPALLGTIVDPPLLLWTRGDAALLDAPAVALVGSRESTMGGREVAFRLAADLAAAGVLVASGFARGIDAAVHRGALSTGRSMAVLGCGLDQPYPSDHGPLGGDIEAAGVLVSEFPPGAPPLSHHFPLRNRALSGLCRAVIVVQAARRSGSLITARLALEQGREVMAVPGDVRTGANAGGHALIRDGARLVECASDILEELGWARVARAERAERGDDDREHGGVQGTSEMGVPAAPAAAALLRQVAREDGVTLDELLVETGRNGGDLLGELLDLELAGLVRRDAAGRFLRAERKW